MEAARHHTPQKREDMIIKILCGGKQPALVVPTVILLDAGKWKAISRRNSASSFSWKGSSKYERYDLKKTSFNVKEEWLRKYVLWEVARAKVVPLPWLSWEVPNETTVHLGSGPSLYPSHVV